MAFNPLSEKQTERLIKSIDWAEQQLEYPRKQRINAVNQFMGSHHSVGGLTKPVPVNFLKMAVDIYVRLLAPQAPRVFITSMQRELRASAYEFELAVNQIPDEIKLGKTLRRFTTEALFSMGVLKCGIAETGAAMGHPYGESFVDDITLDDYFVDMSAKRIDQIQYEGNTYWADFEKVMDAGWVRKQARAGLSYDENTVIGEHGQKRAEGVATNGTADTFRDRIWLRDVWLPEDSLMVTIGVTSKKVLRIIERDGPDIGPYIKLGFTDVPGLLLPLAPVQVWIDLHELGNALYRKLGNQADSEKTVLGFPGGQDEDVSNFKGAMDGDGISYSGAEAKKLTAGGINPNTLAFYLQNKDLSSYFAGNADSLGGLSPMTKTVGQDKLLSEAAGAQMQSMSQLSVEAISDVFTTLAYYEWNDPIRRRTLEKKIPGADISIKKEWGQESKNGEFSFYDLSIDVYSLQSNSPGTKLQKLGFVTNTYILPFAPLIEKVGGQIDVKRLLELVSRYSDMPEVGEIVTFVDQPESGQAPKKQGMPANTTRTYETSSQTGLSKEGASAAAQQELLSQGDGDSDST